MNRSRVRLSELECVSLVRALPLNLYKVTSRIISPSLVLGQVLSPVKFLLRHSLSAGCKLKDQSTQKPPFWQKP